MSRYRVFSADTVNQKPLERGQKLYRYDGTWIGRIYTVQGSWCKVRLMKDTLWMAVNHIRERFEVR